MALAAFASVLMGNSLEGGLLLAMFNLAHIGKFQNGLLLALVFWYFGLADRRGDKYTSPRLDKEKKVRQARSLLPYLILVLS